jgi:hypothetical protein
MRALRKGNLPVFILGENETNATTGGSVIHVAGQLHSFVNGAACTTTFITRHWSLKRPCCGHPSMRVPERQFTVLRMQSFIASSIYVAQLRYTYLWLLSSFTGITQRVDLWVALTCSSHARYMKQGTKHNRWPTWHGHLCQLS